MQNFGTNGLISDKDFGILSDSASGDDHSLLGRLMHHQTLTCIVLFILLLLGYITIGSWMETKHFSVGHETGVIIIIGIIISALLELWTGNNLKIISWSNDMFFFVLLPLIIFATGYNMRREKFFENIKNIIKFGVVGTIVTFVVYFSLTYGFFYFIPGNRDGNITFYNPHTQEHTPFHLNQFQILYMCSILSSSDIIAAVTLVKYDQQPKLFSIILGEGLANDAVAIILFQVMSEVIEIEGETIPYQKVIVQGPVDFLRLVVLSVLIGLFFGVIATLITKNQRSISHSSILESALFISFAMVSYFIGEFTENSAIVCMLVTSMFLSHYTYYNLSPQGKVVISVTVQTLGYMAEATVFGYVGIVSAQTLRHAPISWQFVLAMFFIVIIGRFAAVFISYGIFSCCSKNNDKLSIRQLSFVSYAALIRGAIAMGLIQKLDASRRDPDYGFDRTYGKPFNSKVEATWKYGEVKNINGIRQSALVLVTQSTILYLIILTTVILGGLTPLVQKFLLPQPKDLEIHEQEEIKKSQIDIHRQTAAFPKSYSVNEETKEEKLLSNSNIEIKEQNMQINKSTNLEQRFAEKMVYYGTNREEHNEQEDDRSNTINTVYHAFQHPNQEKKESREKIQSKDITFCQKDENGNFIKRPCGDYFSVEFFNFIDRKYIRPCLIHKYNKISRRKEFLLEEMMEEYKQIEKELNEEDSDEDNILNFNEDNKTYKDETYRRSQTGGGLLSQYVASRLRKHGDLNGELSVSINQIQKDQSFYYASNEFRNKSNFVKSVTIKLGQQDQSGFDSSQNDRSVASFNNKKNAQHQLSYRRQTQNTPDRMGIIAEEKND